MGYLRFLLALSVLATHFGSIFGIYLVPGETPVQIFFILSGFYMSLVLQEKYIGINNSYGLFITNRLLRLYPLYFTILTFSVVAYLIIGFATDFASFPVFEDYAKAGPGVGATLFLILSHLLIIGQDLVLFMGLDNSSGNLFFTTHFWDTSPWVWSLMIIPPAWSLSVELFFYLLAPFIVRARWYIVIGLMLLSLILRLVLYYHFQLTTDPWTDRFLPIELFFFLLGCTSYWIYTWLKAKCLPEWVNIAVFSIVMVSSLSYAYMPATTTFTFHFTAWDITYFFLVTAAIPFLFLGFRNNRFDALLGNLSYPIYLSHWPIAKICGALPYTIMHNGSSVTIITILFSLLLEGVIVTPLEKLRKGRIHAVTSTLQVRS